MRQNYGFTLVELLIGVSVTALIVTVLMTVYNQGSRGYHQIETQQLTDRAVETALVEMETATREAMYAEIVNDRLHLTMPVNRDSYNNPLPDRNLDQPVYRTGPVYAYYLSDSSGSPTRSGTNLWRGQVGAGGSITPDMQLAFPINRFVTTVITESNGIYLVIHLETTMNVRGQIYKAVRDRVYLLMNANSWR